jgi:hypothetical protein
MSTEDAFWGIWEMDVAASDYGDRPMPLQATYVIRPNHDTSGYTFDMAWTSGDGQAMTASYDAIPDGERYPFGDPAQGGAIALVRVNAGQLDSYSFAGNAVVAQASRLLSADGNTMTITQWGMGVAPVSALRSVSIYRRS